MGDLVVVKWRSGWTDSEFMAAVMAAGGLERGSVVVLEYAHDATCPRVCLGGACRCDPDVTATIRPAQGAA